MMETVPRFFGKQATVSLDLSLSQEFSSQKQVAFDSLSSCNSFCLDSGSGAACAFAAKGFAAVPKAAQSKTGIGGFS